MTPCRTLRRTYPGIVKSLNSILDMTGDLDVLAVKGDFSGLSRCAILHSSFLSINECLWTVSRRKQFVTKYKHL